MTSDRYVFIQDADDGRASATAGALALEAGERNDLIGRYPSYDLFETKITPTRSPELLDIVQTSIARREPCVIASQNLHGLRLSYENDDVRKLHDLDATFVHIDGMPIVALCKLAGIEASRDHRVTLVDFIWPLLRTAQANGWRVFYLGAEPNVHAAGINKIRSVFPTLEIAGHHGFFDFDDERASETIVTEIRRYRPDLVLVGMGMARQESWILKHHEELAPATFMTVGACLEYLAGVAQTPPRWMGRAGLEWLFRFAEKPTRFWHRYLVEPWIVLAHVGLAFYKSSATARAKARLQATSARDADHFF